MDCVNVESAVSAQVQNGKLQETLTDAIDAICGQAITTANERLSAVTKLLESLGCSSMASRGFRMRAQFRATSMLIFFIVLIGCEMDYIGFAMAFHSYWRFNGDGAPVVKLMLVTMPLAFLFAIVLYMQMEEEVAATPAATPAASQASRFHQPKPNPLQSTSGKEMFDRMSSQMPELDGAGMVRSGFKGSQMNFGKAELDRRNRHMNFGGDVPQPDPSSQQSSELQDEAKKAAETEERARQLVVREKFILKVYHFLPFFRTYLVVKPLNKHDVEAIFRVNSLSTFTLGLAQMVGMVFTIFDSSAGKSASFGDLPLVVKINIFSFLVNFMITVLYFSTPIAVILKNSFEFDALRDNIMKQIDKNHRKLLQAAQDDAKDDKNSKQLRGSGASSDRSASSAIADGMKENQGERISYIKKFMQYEIMYLCGVSVDLSWFNPGDLQTIQKAIYAKHVDAYT